ncbi:MAG: GDSL-type esterase/lipase family protein [Sarcina sp.]
MKKSHKNFLIITITLTLSFILINVLLISSKKGLVLNTRDNTTQNLKELKDLEKSNVNDVKKDIDKVQKNLPKEDVDEKKPDKPNLSDNSNAENETDGENTANENDTQEIEPKEQTNYKDVFSNSVIMGDSQTQGLTIYGFLDTTSVIGVKGGGISDATTKNMDILSNLSPSNVFTLYGMNDILNYQSNIDGFINDYSILIKKIKVTLPDSKIFVNSILPVEAKVTSSRPIYKQIDAYNVALKAMCNDLSITYVDSHKILLDNPTLFEGDGMHLKPSFYNNWLDLLSNYI